MCLGLGLLFVSGKDGMMWLFHKHEWELISKQAGEEVGWGFKKGFRKSVTMLTYQCQANPLHLKQKILLGEPL